MPSLQRGVRPGACRPGGVVGYPLDQLLGEVAFIAYHFHWPQRDIMELEHADRRHWVEEISSINRQLSEVE
jgi:hypothetical protein